MIFVVSMGDLFHESVKFEWIAEVMGIIQMCPQHTFQILTKRPERMKDFYEEFDYMQYFANLPNVWLGVTAENQDQANKRIPILLEIPAKVHFVSVEPMLSEIDLVSFPNNRSDFGIINELDWIICGGESGHNARHMHIDWVRNLRDQCKGANVPFFFKQGSQSSWKNFKDFDSFPEDLQIRQFPKL